MFQTVKSFISEIFKEVIIERYSKYISWGEYQKGNEDIVFINIDDINLLEFEFQDTSLDEIIPNPFKIKGDIIFKIEAKDISLLEKGVFIFLASLVYLDKVTSRYKYFLSKRYKKDIIEKDTDIEFLILDFKIKRIKNFENKYYKIETFLKGELEIKPYLPKATPIREIDIEITQEKEEKKDNSIIEIKIGDINDNEREK